MVESLPTPTLIKQAQHGRYFRFYIFRLFIMKSLLLSAAINGRNVDVNYAENVPFLFRYSSEENYLFCVAELMV